MSRSTDSTLRCWTIVPAAGASRRMGAIDAPKQYLPLAGRTVIEWSLAPFLERDDCEAIVVVLAGDDRRWRELEVAQHSKVVRAIGGAQRVDSVRAGLLALAQRAGDNDWVLVHDAARPCLASGDLDRLISRLWGDETGGLLAVPVVDTLKRSDGDNRVLETVSRASLWRALTPQMFRYGLLRRALTLAAERNIAVTDEAQAIETLGLHPRLIAGDPGNIKITVPDDLDRAAQILKTRPAA